MRTDIVWGQQQQQQEQEEIGFRSTWIGPPSETGNIYEVQLKIRCLTNEFAPFEVMETNDALVRLDRRSTVYNA